MLEIYDRLKFVPLWLHSLWAILSWQQFVTFVKVIATRAGSTSDTLKNVLMNDKIITPIILSPKKLLHNKPTHFQLKEEKISSRAETWKKNKSLIQFFLLHMMFLFDTKYYFFHYFQNVPKFLI